MLFVCPTYLASPWATRNILRCSASAAILAALLPDSALANASQLAPVPPPPSIEVLMKRAAPQAAAPQAVTSSPPALADDTPPLSTETMVAPSPQIADAPQPAPLPSPAPPAASNTEQHIQAVKATVLAWAAAWSARDVDAYLGFYAGDFVPTVKQQRSQWERERRTRILRNSAIEVRVSQLEVRVAGAHAVARFRQEYRAPTLSVSSTKDLRLANANGQWRIIKETETP
jgi:ketosteroid isomerase-like protein